MLSRRRFLQQTSLIAASGVVTDSLFSTARAGSRPESIPDAKLLERARALLKRAP